MKDFKVPDTLIKRNVNSNIELAPYRTEFMRDRDRMLYATAFRRLSGKTQIYTVGNDDHKRNRMTHTLEVAQIARTISKALDLDQDLTEAIALGHDFGHAPFGHAGEKILHDIMIPNSKYVKNSPFIENEKSIQNRIERECPDDNEILDYAYGFKHNIQSLRIATALEDSYRDGGKQNIGLNLTNVTLYGIMSHSKLEYSGSDVNPNYQNEYRKLWSYDEQGDVPAWSFEAFVVEWADEIAQWHHDLEDALRGKALPKSEIVDIVGKLSKDRVRDEELLKIVKDKDGIDRNVLANLAHIIVNFFVDDIINQSRINFQKLFEECNNYGNNESDEFRKKFFIEYDDFNFSIPKDKVISFSDNVILETTESIADGFKKVIREAVHHSNNVERMNEKGAYIIRKLFQAYYSHPQQLPDGPILHLLVECKEYVKKACEKDKKECPSYEDIDSAKAVGIGKARSDFDLLLRNPNIFVQIHLMRRICDHIASMTDHYAIEEYTNLYG